MSLLSTLGPLLDPFWWILAYFVTPGKKQMTFDALNDDCILLILEHLTAPQLLQLRAVSRRLSYLTERYRLPQYKTLLYGWSQAEAGQRRNEANSGTSTVSLYVSTRFYAYSQFQKTMQIGPCDHSPFFSRNRQLIPLKLNTFPPSLPSLLPRLASLAGTNFLVNKGEMPTEEQVRVNQTLAHWLDSSWSNTLVSLHLFLQVQAQPQPDTAFFDHLSKLSALAHLFLEFNHFVTQEPSSSPILPNNMPVLSQLTSFSLKNYGGLNTATLLAQLGPNLSFLSLYNIHCTTDDYTAFLTSKPSYGQTLKTLEVDLHRNRALQLITATVQCLHSLRCFCVSYNPMDIRSSMSIVSYFTHLARLSHLREISYLPLYIYQLYVLGLHYLDFGSLPRVAAIRVAIVVLIDDDDEDDTFDASEFYDDLLPLLAKVFSSLEHLYICLLHGSKAQYSEPLTVQLLTRAAQIFKGIRSCTATYKCQL